MANRTCNHCGATKPVELFSSRTETGRWCKECCAKKIAVWFRTLNGQFVTSRIAAKGRGLVWDISRQDYRLLRSQQCHYCGDNLPETSCGLDRKDAALGYTLTNVVPCCLDCNQAKNAAFTYEEMLLIGKTIATIKEARRKEGRQRPNSRKPRPKQVVLQESHKPQRPGLFDHVAR